MDSSKFQSVKVNIAFHKLLDDTPKVSAEGESLNKCSEFWLFVLMGRPKGRKNLVRLALSGKVMGRITAPHAMSPGTYEAKSKKLIPVC